MTSWISWIAVGLMVACFLYAAYCVFSKKPRGLYFAALCHVVLGILSLPSIGLYVIGIAVLEFLMGSMMWGKHRRLTNNG